MKSQETCSGTEYSQIRRPACRTEISRALRQLALHAEVFYSSRETGSLSFIRFIFRIRKIPEQHAIGFLIALSDYASLDQVNCYHHLAQILIGCILLVNGFVHVFSVVFQYHECPQLNHFELQHERRRCIRFGRLPMVNRSIAYVSSYRLFGSHLLIKLGWGHAVKP